jgi:hypothetical protein
LQSESTDSPAVVSSTQFVTRPLECVECLCHRWLVLRVGRHALSRSVRPLRIEMGGLADTNPAPIPLLIEDVPVRAALNEIAKRTNAHFWIVARFGKKGEYLIDF